jgi:N12 class adenine-specific DNA methylase
VWDLKDAREKAAKLLDGEISPEEAIGKYNEPSLWLDFAESLENIDDIKRLMRFRFQASYTGSGDERRISSYYMSPRSDSDWTVRAGAENREAFYENVRSYIQQQKEVKTEGGSQRKPAELQASGVEETKFGRKRTIGYAIWYKLSFGGWKIWRQFEDIREARAYLEANRDDILSEIDDKRDGAQTGAEWLAEPPPRDGVSHRKGDITPEQFAETFGLSVKDFGFGKSETGQEQQDRLNDAWDALHDLAGVLDLPLKALFFDGSLKLAFGRRGTGGRNPAAAHYELGPHLINLTRKHGAGTLAHEWLHALDLGMRPGVGEEGNAEREARRDLARALLKANAPWFKRAKDLDEYRAKDYWSTREELAARAFEKLVYDRLKMRKMGNGFLVGIDQSSGAYPTTREMRRQGVTEAYDAWLAIVRDRFANKGDEKVTLPKPDPSLLDDSTPQVGDKWNGPDGIVSEITKIDGQIVSFTTTKDGKETQNEMSLSEVEDLIDRMAEYNDPEKIAEREAREAKEAEAQEKARIAEEERKAARERLAAEDEAKYADLDAQAEQLVAQFISDTKRKPEAIEEKLGQYSPRFRIGSTWNMTAAAKILQLMRDDDGTVVDGKLRFGPYRSNYFDNLNLKVHGDFAAWVLAKGIEIAPARKSPAEAEAEAEAALADVFGGADATTDQEAPPSETAVSETETAPQSNAGQEASPGTPRTAGQAATSAAKNVGMGLDDLSKGLTELFGGANKLSSGLTFDSETYEKAKPYFIDAARKFAAAGADMVALAKALKAGFTDALKLDAATIQNMMPYFKQFLLDVDAGKIDPWAKEEADAGDNADAGSTGSEDLEDVDADVSDDPRGGAGGTATSGGASTGGNGGVGDGAPDAGDSGPDAGGSLGNGGGAISADPAAVLTGENPGNFTITDDFALGEGAPKERIENNLAALRLLRELQAAGRYATKEEQAILARYVGWGGLKRAFDVKEADSANVWGKAYRDLKDLLTDTEYNNALKSTRNAHYTSRTVVDAMWLAMRHMGVKGGRGLEPTVGTGNFLGLTPDGMNVEWYGTELDPMTGRIAQYLYPDATIFPGRGFEDAPFAFGAYDFAIGNPPFGSNKVSDATPTTADLNGLKIHNYVMAKTARHLRPGGIMGMVVTSRFMDGASNAEGRDAMVRDGMKFLGGVRLPNTAFKANAGTEVVTDVLFFQKGRPGEASGISWTETAEVQTDQGPATINAYFAQNPDNVLGKNAKTGTMYQDAEYTVEDDGRDLRVALNNAFRKSLPQGAFGDPVEHQVDALMADTRNDLPVGGLALMDDGRIFLNEQMGDSLRGTPVEVTPDSPWTNDAGDWVRVLNAARALRADPTPEAMREFREAAQAFMSWNAADEIFVKRKPKNKAEEAVYAIFDRVEAAGLTDGALNKRGLPDLIGEIEKIASKRQLGEDGFARLKAMLDLRNRVNALLNIERTTEGNETPEMKKARADLKKAYTTFKKKFGYLGDKVNSDILRGDIGMEQAVEASYQKPTGVKKDGTFVDSAAMEGPILERRVARPIEEITKADSPEDALIISMQERGRPDLPWMASLTGQSVSDVRRDLMERDDPLLFRDPETNELVFVEEYLSGNVREKLRQARDAGMEANVRALEDVQPPPVAQDRITPSMSATWIPAETLQEFLEDLGGRGAKVFRDLAVGVTEVEVSNFEPTPLGTPFQHPKANFARLARAAITGKAIVITEKQADGKSVKDEEASKSASALADQMGALFRQWAFQSPRRADELVERYNEVMNTRRERVWDGERYLRPKGANEVLIEKMRRTQKNGAWRMIQSPSSLMHHVVGAGKTWTATMAVMERKRLGLSKKPMVAVPNHLTEQWADEWRQVYPGANLLVVGGKDMNKDERRRMLARMATTDVDAIIISHQALSYIENDAAIEEAMLNESIATMREALDRARKEGQSKRTIGQIGTRIDNQEKKIQKLRERKTDKMAGVTFETLGVDYLAVDEAHLFKNLEYFSLGDRLVGMNDPNGSKRAFDLFVKTRSIRTRYKSGGISFLTGTPVSNSLVEIYTMLKYLAWDELKAEGLSEFDAFAGNYIEAETRFEITASQQVKERRVLAGLMNLSALAAQYRQFSDIILRPDLERIYAETQREWNDAHPDEPPRSERFPTPKVKGGKRRLLTAPATETQRQVTDWLVARMAAIKAATDKKEYAKIDNPLVVLTDARKAGLDPRTIDPTQVRDKDSKVNRSAREIKRIYDQWQGDRGAQLVFSDLSTPVSSAKGQGKAMLKESAQKLLGKTKGNAWIAEMEAAGRDYVDRWEMLNERAVEMLDDEATPDADRRRIEEWMENVDPDMEATMLTLDSGFSMYDDLKAVLIEDHGIPESEIAFVHDAKNDEAKHALFDRVRKGEVRVLIGSTPKMGAGTNVQRRLVALHHLDAPWRPSDVEQREGRIVRSGNDLYARDPEGFEVELLAYSTEGTSDVVMWQVLERKAAAIEQFLSGAVDTMDEGESDSASFADFMAQSTGDSVFRDRLAQDAITTRLRSDIEGRELAKASARRDLEWETRDATRRRAEKAAADAALETFKPLQEFIAAWPETKKTRADQKDPPALSPLEELAGIEAEERGKHEAAVDRWEKKVAEVRAERETMREKGAPEDRWPDVPVAPSRPGMLSQAVREKSTVSKAIYDALGQINPNDSSATVEAQYGNLGKIIVEAKGSRNVTSGQPTGSTFAQVFFQPKGSTDRVLVGGQETKNPQVAPEIQRNLWPSAIINAIANRATRNEERLTKIEERIPRLQELADSDDRPGPADPGGNRIELLFHRAEHGREAGRSRSAFARRQPVHPPRHQASAATGSRRCHAVP